MMTAIEKSARMAGLMAAFILTVACGDGHESNDVAGADQGAPSVLAPQAALQDNENTDKAKNAQPIAAGAYLSEWDKAGATCRDGLAALNKKSTPTKAPSTDDAADYAVRQARRLLALEGAINWHTDEFPAPGAFMSERAAIDYFNDGVERTLVRYQSKLGGQSIVGLGVEDPATGSLSLLSFAYAGVQFDDLPDSDNLNTKLTYSVSNVIKLPGGYFTLLAPLIDVDKSGRVYLIVQRAKDGTAAPRAPLDYYPELACVFRTTGAVLAAAE